MTAIMSSALCSAASVGASLSHFGMRSPGFTSFAPAALSAAHAVTAAAESTRSWIVSGPKIRSNAAHSNSSRASIRSSSSEAGMPSARLSL